MIAVWKASVHFSFTSICEGQGHRSLRSGESSPKMSGRRHVFCDALRLPIWKLVFGSPVLSQESSLEQDFWADFVLEGFSQLHFSFFTVSDVNV